MHSRTVTVPFGSIRPGPSSHLEASASLAEGEDGDNDNALILKADYMPRSLPQA